MSMIWMDGFDFYGSNSTSITAALARNYNAIAGAGFNAEAGRYGGSALYCSAYKNSTTMFKNFASSAATKYFIGFNYKQSGSQISYTEFTLGSVVSNSMSTARGFYVTATNVKLNNSVASGFSMSDNTWYHIEMEIPVTPSGGDPCKLYIDGVLVASTTTTFNWTNILGMATAQLNGSTFQVWVDDFYVMDNLGTANNARIGLASYIPRIEYIQPVSDVTNNFTLTGSTIGSTNVTNDVETDTTITAFASRLGLTNVSWNETNPYPAVPSMRMYRVGSLSGDPDASLTRSGTKAFTVGRIPGYAVQSGSVNFYLQFDTIATSFSFWAVKSSYSAGRVAFNVIINGVSTQYEVIDTYQQFTFSLSGVSTVRITPSTALSSSFAFITDDWQFNYSSQQASYALYQVPMSSSRYLNSTTNGNKILCNMEDLATINTIKAVCGTTLATDVTAGLSSSLKFLANSGGADTEIGSTKTVTGNLTSTSPYTNEIFDINPLTAAAWSASDINNIKLGVINKT